MKIVRLFAVILTLIVMSLAVHADPTIQWDTQNQYWYWYDSERVLHFAFDLNGPWYVKHD